MGLKLNCPYFRSTNALFHTVSYSEYLKITGEEEELIVNIHNYCLREDEWKKGVFVKGNYFYYHYNQQGFADKGWGCAYRSLQTLCSFFVLNHYAELRIPTIPEVCI